MLTACRLNRRCAFSGAGIASSRAIAKRVLNASVAGINPAEQRRGFDLVEGPVGGDITPRLADPVARGRSPGQAHGFSERLVNVAGRQALERAIVACVRVSGRPVRRVDLDQRAELAPEIAP